MITTDHGRQQALLMLGMTEDAWVHFASTHYKHLVNVFSDNAKKSATMYSKCVTEMFMDDTN